MAGCAPNPDLQEVHSGDADVSTFIVLGDGFMVGYQDGAMSQHGLARSVGALMYRSMEGVGAESFNQHVLPGVGGLGVHSKPWEGSYTYPLVMGTRIDCEGTSSLGPVRTFHTGGSETPYLDPIGAGSPNNFAFPQMTIEDLFSTDFDTRNVFYNRVAWDLTAMGYNRPIDAVSGANPTFFAGWLGMENIYRYARKGGYNESILPSATFATYLDSVLDAMPGAKGALATIPDFKSFPYYTLVPYNSLDLPLSTADSLNDIYVNSGLSHISFQEGSNGFVIDDAAAPAGVRQLQSGEYILLTVPLDSMKCEFYGVLFSTIHDQYILDVNEVALLEAAIADYNQVIRQAAASRGLALVDMHSYFQTIQSGIKWNGEDYDAEFASGGFFSLDGFFPHEKGYLLIANQFIQAINTTYNAAIPNVNCPDCNGVLFP